MSILSEKKIEQLFKSMHGFPYPNDLYAFARAIEAAVLEAQKQKQEPFIYVKEEWLHYEQCSEGDDGAIACYVAPVVQPEPKEAGYWCKCHGIAEATNVALRKQIAELIAAAEGKK